MKKQKPNNVQEYDGYFMPETDEIKKLPYDELDKLMENVLSKYKNN